MVELEGALVVNRQGIVGKGFVSFENGTRWCVYVRLFVCVSRLSLSRVIWLSRALKDHILLYQTNSCY